MQIRFPAEWEAQSAVQLTWPHANSDWGENLMDVEQVFTTLARAIARFQKVVVVCQSSSHVQNCLGSIPPSQLILVEIPSNDTWARDHAGITVFTAGKPQVLDFRFNGWGNKYESELDDAITASLYKNKVFSEEVILSSINMVLEGGAVEADGAGTLLTTEQCLLNPNRNGWGKQTTEEKLKRYLGVERVLWLQHGSLSGDDTDGHIDTIARFANEDTILYCKADDASHPDYGALHSMEQELKQFKSLKNNPYNLVPLPMPTLCTSTMGDILPATYANFLIINGAVLVPTYGCQQDEQALKIIDEYFEKREIIPVNCRLIIEQYGSLHCLTMQYPQKVIQ